MYTIAANILLVNGMMREKKRFRFTTEHQRYVHAHSTTSLHICTIALHGDILLVCCFSSSLKLLSGGNFVSCQLFQLKKYEMMRDKVSTIKSKGHGTFFLIHSLILYSLIHAPYLAVIGLQRCSRGNFPPSTPGRFHEIIRPDDGH